MPARDHKTELAVTGHPAADTAALAADSPQAGAQVFYTVSCCEAARALGAELSALLAATNGKAPPPEPRDKSQPGADAQGEHAASFTTSWVAAEAPKAAEIPDVRSPVAMK